MNKWLALYAVLCITTIIGLAQLGWEYETEGYGLHPAIAGLAIIAIGLGYWFISKLFSYHTPKKPEGDVGFLEPTEAEDSYDCSEEIAAAKAAGKCGDCYACCAGYHEQCHPEGGDGTHLY